MTYANLISADHSEEERDRLAQLVKLFCELPVPPDPHQLYPDYAFLKERLEDAVYGEDPDRIESDLLRLYDHLHGYEVPYTDEERQRVVETHGYLNHVGGLSPILRAGPFVQPETVSCDYGAGNGLQGLLLQKLSPHRKTIQIEISSLMVSAGHVLQEWLGVADEQVEWITSDIRQVSPDGIDFIYLYRPVRPQGAGKGFYEQLAADLATVDRPVVIFSIADCLRDFLPETFEVFYTDGHLTCMRNTIASAR